MKKLKIRSATRGDRPAILALIRMFPDKLMQKYLPSYRSFFVAKKGGQIVGCCALQVYSKRMCEVRSLAVHPKHRGNGIGKRLIESCVARARDLKIAEICTVTGSKALFEASGFNTFQGEKFAMLIVLRD